MRFMIAVPRVSESSSRLVADQAARRDVEAQARAAGARGAHLDELAFALDSFCTTMPVCSSSTSMMTSSIGSSFSPFSSREHDARPADGQLEALAAHGLDQDAELQFAAAGDLEGILVVALGDLDRDVAFGFAQQALADDAALHLVAFVAGERAVIDAEVMTGSAGRSAAPGSARSTAGSDSVSATVASVKPGDGDDVAGLGLSTGGAPGRGRRAPWRRGTSRLPRRRGQRLDGCPALTAPERMRPVRRRPRNGLARWS